MKLERISVFIIFWTLIFKSGLAPAQQPLAELVSPSPMLEVCYIWSETQTQMTKLECKTLQGGVVQSTRLIDQVPMAAGTFEALKMSERGLAYVKLINNANPTLYYYQPAQSPKIVPINLGSNFSEVSYDIKTIGDADYFLYSTQQASRHGTIGIIKYDTKFSQPWEIKKTQGALYPYVEIGGHTPAQIHLAYQEKFTLQSATFYRSVDFSNQRAFPEERLDNDQYPLRPLLSTFLIHGRSIKLETDKSSPQDVYSLYDNWQLPRVGNYVVAVKQGGQNFNHPRNFFNIAFADMSLTASFPFIVLGIQPHMLSSETNTIVFLGSQDKGLSWTPISLLTFQSPFHYVGLRLKQVHLKSGFYSYVLSARRKSPQPEQEIVFFENVDLLPFWQEHAVAQFTNSSDKLKFIDFIIK